MLIGMFLLVVSVLGRFLSAECCENHLAQTAPPQVRNFETESVPKHCQIDPNCAICFTRILICNQCQPARWKCIPFLPIKSQAVVAWESSWANKLPKTMGPCWILCASQKIIQTFTVVVIWVLIKTSCPNISGMNIELMIIKFSDLLLLYFSVLPTKPK